MLQLASLDFQRFSFMLGESMRHGCNMKSIGVGSVLTNWKDLGSPNAGGICYSERNEVMVELKDSDAEMLKANQAGKFRLIKYSEHATDTPYNLGKQIG